MRIHDVRDPCWYGLILLDAKSNQLEADVTKPTKSSKKLLIKVSTQKETNH